METRISARIPDKHKFPYLPCLALASAARSLKTRSLVFVLSDFQGPNFRKELTAVARRHDVVGLHLVDPGERALPSVGLIEVRDPETGVSGVLDLADARTREGLAHLAEERERRVEDVFRRAGSDRLLLATDRSYAADLAAFFAARAQARNAACRSRLRTRSTSCDRRARRRRFPEATESHA